MGRKRLGEILVEAGLLDAERLRGGLAEQRRTGGYLGQILVRMKLVSEEAVVHALSLQTHFPTVNLDPRDIPQEVLDLVPSDMAEKHQLLPFAVDGKFLDIAMVDPAHLSVLDEIRIRTRLNVRPHLVGQRMWERALARHYHRGPGTLELGIDPAVSQNVHDGMMPTGARMLEATPEGFRPAQPRRAPTREMKAVTEVPPLPLAPDTATLLARIQQLETLVARDENVLRQLLGVLIEKGVLTREELVERLK